MNRMILLGFIRITKDNILVFLVIGLYYIFLLKIAHTSTMPASYYIMYTSKEIDGFFEL